MKPQNVLNLLGLAQRAGKVLSGDFAIEKALAQSRVKLLLLATDAAVSSKKKYQERPDVPVPVIEYGTKAELGYCIGKNQRAALAVTDQGFADLIRQNIGS